MGIRDKYRDKYRVKIGFVPTRRETFSETAFRLDKAAETKKKVEERLTAMQVDYVNIDFLNEEGLLYRSRDAEKVAEYLNQQKVDAIFIAHVNFGCEEAVARLASMVRKPCCCGPCVMMRRSRRATVSVTPSAECSPAARCCPDLTSRLLI